MNFQSLTPDAATEDLNTGVPALSDPRTRRALWIHLLRSLSVAAAAAIPVGIAIAVLPSWTGVAEWIAIIVLGLSSVFFVGGLAGAANAARMWRLLRARPWDPWRSRFEEVLMGTPNPEPTLMLIDGDGRGHLLTVPTWVWRWGGLRVCDRATVLFVGDPDRGGVAAPPARGQLFWVRRPFSRRFRNLLWRSFEGDGLEIDTEPWVPRAELPEPGSPTWRFVQSLWIVATLTLGFLSWAAFVYAGIRARKAQWALWGAVYLVAFVGVVAVSNALDAPAIAGIGWVVITAISFAHALTIRREFLSRVWSRSRTASLVEAPR